MGWKHTPAKWWKDAEAEFDAYDAKVEAASRQEPWWATAMIDEIEVRLPVITYFPLCRGVVNIP